MIDPEIRENVPHRQVGHSILGPDGEKHTQGNRQTEIAQQDQLRVLRLVQRARRVEVVDATEHSVPLAFAATLWLTLMLVVTRDVGSQIVEPAAELLPDQSGGCDNRRFLGQLRDLMDIAAYLGRIFLAGLGHKHHIPFEVAGGLVMFAMGNLPGEIRNQERRVAQPSHSVVQRLRR